MGFFSKAVSKVRTTVGSGIARIRGKSYQPTSPVKTSGTGGYTISVSGTSAGQTRTTSGGTVSTPGTSATPGISRGGSSGGSSIAKYSTVGTTGKINIPPPTKTIKTSTGRIVPVKDTTKPKVYYSPTAGWTPTKDKNAVVVYTTKGGKTTGKTSLADLNIQKGFDVSGTYKTPSGKYVSGRSLIDFEYAEPTTTYKQQATESQGLGDLNKPKPAKFTRPWFEKNVIARTSGGGISTFGTVSKSYFELGEHVIGKARSIGINIPLLPPVKKATAIKFGSDLLTTSFFSPAFAPTYQIEKQIASTDILAFKGKSTPIEGKNILKTEAKFVTASGEKGSIVGVSTARNVGEDLTASVTAGAGKTVKTGFEFPTLRTIKTSKPFKGVQASLTKTTDDTFVSVSRGAVKDSKGVIKQFKGYDLGKFNEAGTVSVGKVTTEGGHPNLFNIGVIENVGKQGKNIKSFIPSTITGTPLSTTFQQQPLANLKNIATAGLKTSARSSTVKNIVARTGTITGTGGITLGLKNVQQPARTSKVLIKQSNDLGLNFKQPTTSLLGTSDRQDLSQNQFMNLGLATIQQNKTKLKSGTGLKYISTQKEGLQQKSALKLKTQQKSRSSSRNMFKIPLTPKQPIRKFPVIPFGFLSFQLPKTKGKKKKSSGSLFIKRTPSLFAIGEQIKSTSFGKLESSGLGIRPIIISKKKRKSRKK